MGRLWTGCTAWNMRGWERAKRRTSSGYALELENWPPFILLAHCETQKGCEYEYAHKQSSPSHERHLGLSFCFSWFENSCPASHSYNLLEQETNQKPSSAWLKPLNCLLKGQLSETYFFPHMLFPKIPVYGKKWDFWDVNNRKTLILQYETRHNTPEKMPVNYRPLLSIGNQSDSFILLEINSQRRTLISTYQI